MRNSSWARPSPAHAAPSPPDPGRPRSEPRPGLAGEERRVGLAPPIDAALGGGLACGALHELAPAAPIHLGAASGFALALAALASGQRAARCSGSRPISRRPRAAGPTAPASTCSACRPRGLLVLRVPRPVDVLWAMEEALRCRALACVIAELTGEGAEADLTATRRLALAAREGAARARASACCSAIAPRRCRARRRPAGRSPPRRASPIAYGGLGRARFRPFSSQEPARTVRPVDHRVGSS